jgi:hypothetical protein
MSLMAMRKTVLGVLVAACVLALSWYCWLFYSSRDARSFEGAKVFVTFHVALAQCDVSVSLSVMRHELPCGDVASYLRDLKLPVNSSFGITDMGNDHGSAIASLTSQLRNEGYSLAGVRTVFVSEPEPPISDR